MAEKAYTPLSCEHQNKVLTCLVCSNGTRQAIHQCLRCGERIGGPQAFATLKKPVDQLPPWDESLREAWRKQRERHYQAWRTRKDEDYQVARSTESAQWWARYNEYLQSDEWRAKRRAVMERARGVCEGCRSARATQVHHLTYQHAGHVVPGGELLWELVAVCDDCHDRAHMRAVSEQERAA